MGRVLTHVSLATLVAAGSLAYLVKQVSSTVQAGALSPPAALWSPMATPAARPGSRCRSFPESSQRRSGGVLVHA